MAKVNTRCTHDIWHWYGAIGHRGYGRFRWNGHVLVAHRVAYALFVGPIPEGLTVHHCEPAAGVDPFRLDVNPEHLLLMTRGANSAEANSRRHRKDEEPPF